MRDSEHRNVRLRRTLSHLTVSVLVLSVTIALPGCGGGFITDLFDKTPPAPVTDLVVEPGDSEVTVAWTPPGDDDLSMVAIHYGEESADQWYDGPRDAEGTVIDGLTNGHEYIFRITAVDDAGNVSEEVSETAIPLAGGGAASGESYGYLEHWYNTHAYDPVNEPDRHHRHIRLYESEEAYQEMQSDGAFSATDFLWFQVEDNVSSTEMAEATYSIGASGGATAAITFMVIVDDYTGDENGALDADYIASVGSGSSMTDNYDSIIAGTLEITKAGDVYTLSWELETRDNGSIVGSYEGVVDVNI